MYVVSVLFSKQRLLCNKKLATSRPFPFVSVQPQRLLWALKSPISMIGGGSCDTSVRSSVCFHEKDGGRYIEHMVMG